MFKKFPSLTNHYQKKEIDRFLQCIDHTDPQFAVFEKIDGANFSILLTANEKPRYFSRNMEITGSDFYSATNVINKTIEELAVLNRNLPEDDETGEFCTVRLFSELFGQGIQKRIDYGPEKRIMFYDIMINDRLITPKEAMVFMRMYNLDHLMVEPLGIYQSFDTAFEFDEIFDTTFGPSKEGGNKAEGIVIKPWNTTVFTPVGSVFYVKKKNPEFADKMKNKVPRERKTYRDEVEDMRDEFLSYLNENTVLSVFSKHGEIQGHKEIGKYIPLILDDARDTFLREVDFDMDDFEKEERKYIFNGGSTIVDLLKPYL